MQETGFICFPSYACKKSLCPSLSHQHLPFICLHNHCFSALPAQEALEKLWRSTAAWGRGGQSTACSPRISSCMNWGGGEPAFVSGAGAAGAAAVSQTLHHPRKRLAEAPRGWGEPRQPFVPARLLGLPFSPPPQMEVTLTVCKHLV